MRYGMKIKYHQGQIKALFVPLKMQRFSCSESLSELFVNKREIPCSLLHIMLLDMGAYSLNSIVKQAKSIMHSLMSIWPKYLIIIIAIAKLYQNNKRSREQTRGVESPQLIFQEELCPLQGVISVFLKNHNKMMWSFKN